MQRFRLSCSRLRPRRTSLQLTKAVLSSSDSPTSPPPAKCRPVDCVARTDVPEAQHSTKSGQFLSLDRGTIDLTEDASGSVKVWPCTFCFRLAFVTTGLCDHKQPGVTWRTTVSLQALLPCPGPYQRVTLLQTHFFRVQCHFTT